MDELCNRRLQSILASSPKTGGNCGSHWKKKVQGGSRAITFSWENESEKARADCVTEVIVAHCKFCQLVSVYSSASPYPVALCWKMSPAPFSELLCISQDKCPLAGKNSGNETLQSSIGSLWWWRLLPGELQKHL